MFISSNDYRLPFPRHHFTPCVGDRVTVYVNKTSELTGSDIRYLLYKIIIFYTCMINIKEGGVASTIVSKHVYPDPTLKDGAFAIL